MRVFLAVPADAGWVASARELTRRLAASLPRASWTRPESWHLTLKFLGEIPEEAAERFAEAIGPAAAESPGGVLSRGGALLLPDPRRPRVLGVGFSPGPALERLAAIAREAQAAGRRAGVPAEKRSFRPHVTLGRLREPWPAEAVEAFRREADGWAFPDWPVRSCILYESRLHPSGAEHRPLREWALAPGAPAVRA